MKHRINHTKSAEGCALQSTLVQQLSAFTVSLCHCLFLTIFRLSTHRSSKRNFSTPQQPPAPQTCPSSKAWGGPMEDEAGRA
jgi:hypothetical protein